MGRLKQYVQHLDHLVQLDAVFNHCGKTFPPFVDALEKGAASPYADWFHVRGGRFRVEDGIPTYETFAFATEKASRMPWDRCWPAIRSKQTRLLLTCSTATTPLAC